MALALLERIFDHALVPFFKGDDGRVLELLHRSFAGECLCVTDSRNGSRCELGVKKYVMKFVKPVLLCGNKVIYRGVERHKKLNDATEEENNVGQNQGLIVCLLVGWFLNK